MLTPSTLLIHSGRAPDDPHHASAGRGPRLSVAQAPGTLAELRPRVRSRPRVLPRADPRGLHGRAAAGDRPRQAGPRRSLGPGRWSALAVRQRPALRRLLVPQRGDRPGFAQRARRHLERPPRARRRRDPADRPPPVRALSRRRGPAAQAVRAARLHRPRHPPTARPRGTRVGHGALLRRPAGPRGSAARAARPPLRADPRARRREALLYRRRGGRQAAARRRGLAVDPPRARDDRLAISQASHGPDPNGARAAVSRRVRPRAGRRRRRHE